MDAVKAHQATLWAEVAAGGWVDIAVVSAENLVPVALPPNAICFLARLDGKPAAGAGQCSPSRSQMQESEFRSQNPEG
jgi:hypothetical protein